VTFSATYGESITAGAPLYIASDASVKNGNATDNTKSPVCGIAVETAASGTHVVLVHGIYRDDTNLTFSTVGGPVYVATSSGTLTQTQPSSTNNVIQVVGIAVGSHTLYVNPQLDYLTHS
jgi:hypothetical protein